MCRVGRSELTCTREAPKAVLDAKLAVLEIEDAIFVGGVNGVV